MAKNMKQRRLKKANQLANREITTYKNHAEWGIQSNLLLKPQLLRLPPKYQISHSIKPNPPALYEIHSNPSSNPYTKENTFPIFPHFRFIGTLLLKKANYRINNVQNIHTQGCFQISHNNPNKPTIKPQKKKKPYRDPTKILNQSSNSPNSQSPFHLQLIKCNK